MACMNTPLRPTKRLARHAILGLLALSTSVGSLSLGGCASDVATEKASPEPSDTAASQIGPGVAVAPVAGGGIFLWLVVALGGASVVTFVSDDYQKVTDGNLLYDIGVSFFDGSAKQRLRSYAGFSNSDDESTIPETSITIGEAKSKLANQLGILQASSGACSGAVNNISCDNPGAACPSTTTGKWCVCEARGNTPRGKWVCK